MRRNNGFNSDELKEIRERVSGRLWVNRENRNNPENVDNNFDPLNRNIPENADNNLDPLNRNIPENADNNLDLFNRNIPEPRLRNYINNNAVADDNQVEEIVDNIMNNQANEVEHNIPNVVENIARRFLNLGNAVSGRNNVNIDEQIQNELNNVQNNSDANNNIINYSPIWFLQQLRRTDWRFIVGLIAFGLGLIGLVYVRPFHTDTIYNPVDTAVEENNPFIFTIARVAGRLVIIIGRCSLEKLRNSLDYEE